MTTRNIAAPMTKALGDLPIFHMKLLIYLLPLLVCLPLELVYVINSAFIGLFSKSQKSLFSSKQVKKSNVLN